MSTHTIIGAQWGDEGKGKITDFRAKQADMVVRFQGGDNAGHTIKFAGKTHKLHLIPSGIFNEDAINVLASGMVINPWNLHKEIIMLNDQGFDKARIVVSNRAHVILPYHQMLDGIREKGRKNKVGTTGKGIGPAYTDKTLRQGLRMETFIDPVAFEAFLDERLEAINDVLTDAGEAPLKKETVLNDAKPVQAMLRPMVTDTSRLVFDYWKQGKRILFEGAQGTMLCMDHGTYPYVTSSSPTAAAVPLGCGISPHVVETVEGIVKAYTTRVGGGSFPSEITGETAKAIQTKGNEFGTTTGRARRVGWLDLVALEHAVRINGFTSLTLTLLDVLEDFETIKVCTAYRIDGKMITHVPADIHAYERCEPVYETLKGFKGPISNVTDYHALPDAAKTYIQFIESHLGVPVGTVSVGPDRTQTFDIIEGVCGLDD